MKKILFVGLCVGLFNLNGSFAADSKPAAVQKSLAGVPASELPAQAAQLVKAAKPADREPLTAEAVKAAIKLRPATASAVVGAIARAVPEMAPAAAGTAAAQQPKQASAIAKAAAAAAPSQAGKIAAAVCKAAPKEYRAVALAVAQAAPGSEKEILQAIGAAFKNSQPTIDQAINTYTGNPASFAAVVASLNPGAASTAQNSVASSTTARGPIIAPPYVAPSGSSANVTPNTSGAVPAGGRDYAKP